MSDLVRRGGRGTLPDGTDLLWSVAEGGRGRRWRAAVVGGGALRRAILIETGADRRLSRLEVEDAAGLLTLHPDGEESVLHGNVVTTDGIRHLTLAWSSRHELLVTPLAFSGAPVAWRLAGHTAGVGEGLEVDAVLVGPDLEVLPERIRIGRASEDGWTVARAATSETIEVDEDGLPAGLIDPQTWPLER